MPVASDVGAVCCGVQLPGGDRATTSKACQLLHADFRQGAPTLRHDYAESAWFVVASRQGHAECAALLFALACLIGLSGIDNFDTGRIATGLYGCWSAHAVAEPHGP